MNKHSLIDRLKCAKDDAIYTVSWAVVIALGLALVYHHMPQIHWPSVSSKDFSIAQFKAGGTLTFIVFFMSFLFPLGTSKR